MLHKIQESPFIKNYLISASVTALTLTYISSISSFVMKEDLLNMPLIAATTVFLIPFVMKYRENNLKEINEIKNQNKELNTSLI